MKKENQEAEKKEKSASYYQLHTDAVDDLIGATQENTPRYSKKELEKYRSVRKKWRLPDGLKAVLIKFWFYGAVCFFVFMGLGMYLGNQWDLFFVAAIVMGMVTDLLINHFLRFTEKLPGGNRRWMMVSRRGTVGFILNLAYAFLLLFLVITAYGAVNALLSALSGGQMVLRVEPLGFGLAVVGADMLCIGVKRMLMKIVADARKKA